MFCIHLLVLHPDSLVSMVFRNFSNYLYPYYSLTAWQPNSQIFEALFLLPQRLYSNGGKRHEKRRFSQNLSIEFPILPYSIAVKIGGVNNRASCEIERGGGWEPRWASERVRSGHWDSSRRSHCHTRGSGKRTYWNGVPFALTGKNNTGNEWKMYPRLQRNKKVGSNWTSCIPFKANFVLKTFLLSQLFTCRQYVWGG